MNQKQIVTKSALYLIGNLSSKFLSAILIPIYGFFVGSTDLGTFDFSQSIMNVLVPVLFVTFWEGVLKFMLVSEDDTRKKVVNTSTVFAVSMTVVYLLISLAGTCFAGDKLIWLGTCSMIVTHGIAYIWQYMCRAVNSTKLYLVSSVAGTVVNLLITIIFTSAIDLDLLGLFLAYSLGQVTIFLVIEVKTKFLSKISLKEFDKVLLKRMLVFSLPLMFNTLGMWLTPLLMRSVITLNIDAVSKGLYAFANKFNIVVNLLGTVVSMALVEEAILSSKKGKISAEYGNTVTRIFVMFEHLATVAILAIAICYPLLRQTEYYVTIKYVGWLLIAALLQTLASYIGTVFQSINITRYQFITTMVGGMAGVVVAYALSIPFGLWGVIIGQVISSLTTMIMRYVIAKQRAGFRINWRMTCLSSILVILAGVCATFVSDVRALLAIGLVVVCVVTCLNRTQIARVIDLLGRKLHRT